WGDTTDRLPGWPPQPPASPGVGAASQGGCRRGRNSGLTPRAIRCRPLRGLKRPFRITTNLSGRPFQFEYGAEPVLCSHTRASSKFPLAWHTEAWPIQWKPVGVDLALEFGGRAARRRDEE